MQADTGALEVITFDVAWKLGGLRIHVADLIKGVMQMDQEHSIVINGRFRGSFRPDGVDRLTVGAEGNSTVSIHTFAIGQCVSAVAI